MPFCGVSDFIPWYQNFARGFFPISMAYGRMGFSGGGVPMEGAQKFFQESPLFVRMWGVNVPTFARDPPPLGRGRGGGGGVLFWFNPIICVLPALLRPTRINIIDDGG